PRGARRLPRRARERRRRRQGGDRMMEWLDNPVFTTWDTNTSLWSNTLITLYMTVGTMLFSTLIGVPLGLLLFETSGARGGLARWVNRIVGFVVSVGRASPSIILLMDRRSPRL